MDMNHGEMTDEKRRMKMEWRNHMATRALVAVIVAIFIFWCGFEFGEIRASVGDMRMQGGWGATGMQTRGVNMYTSRTLVSPAQPIAPTTTVTPAQ